MNVEIRKKAIEYYFENGTSLRETAKIFNVHYQTIFKWVKIYKEKKEEFFTGYRRPWNRFPKQIEEKIILLKENEPTLTVRKAKEILEEEGIKISIKGIWNVWKRYGYTGFKKENLTNDFTEYTEWTKEAKFKYEYAKEIFEKNEIEKCAKILNSIPSLPKNELITKIPDDLLNLKRKVEKTAILFGKLPLGEYIAKIQKLYKELEINKFYYSALIIGIIEIISLQWKGEFKESLKKINKIKIRINKKKNSTLFPLYFNILLSEGIAHAFLTNIKKGIKISQICYNMLKKRKYVSPHFYYYLGTLYMNLEKFKKAEYFFLKCLNRLEEKTDKRIKGRLAIIYLLKGNYKKALEISKDGEFGEWSIEGWNLLFNSLIFLIKGMPDKSISLCKKALSFLKPHEISWGIFVASFTMAAAYSSLGEKNIARNILKEILPFIEKIRLKRESPIIKLLISNKKILKKENIFPTTRLLLLLKKYGYKKALSYAKKNYLLSYLYRYILFLPEKINEIVEKGEKVEIPKNILNLPAFNTATLSFYIKFLSPFKIYRNQKKLKRKLSFKEKTFLIFISEKLKAPGAFLDIQKIFETFWPSSSSPRRNFSRLLSNIKIKLKIPDNLLILKRKKEETYLTNKGIYFITDQDELDETIIKAKAFLKIKENKEAKKKFLKAFSLIKCEPFKNMYDRFSEDKRTEIIFKIKDAYEDFLKTNPSKKEIEKIEKKFEKLKILIK